MNKGVGRKRKQLENANMPTTNYLLVIGINDYDSGIPKLNNAVRDAKTFEAILNKKYDFKAENTTRLYEEDATKDNILAAFDTIIRNLSKDDSLVFYFSGHGELVQEINRGYWIPVEARANKRGSYLNTVEITDFVKSCKAKHVLGVVDACYSGSLLRKISNPLLQKYFTKTSRRIMTSGLIEPVPDGPPNTHSPFAAALISALEHNTKPYLSATALWQEMQEGLAANTFASAQFESMQNVGHQGGDFFFLSNEHDSIPPVELAETASEDTPTRNVQAGHTPTPVAAKEEDYSSLPLDEWKTKMKRLAVTDIKRALTQAEKRIDTSGDAFNSLLLLQSRYHSAKKNQDQGLVTDQQSNISFNRIKAAFSSFIDDLEDYDVV